MEKHDNVLKGLNEEFKKMDRAYQTGEMRIFGENTGKIFKELDVIRRKQIDLATDHVSLEALNDIPLKQTATTTTNQARPNHTLETSVFSAKNFEKKQLALKHLMNKLGDLTQALEQFERIYKVDYQSTETPMTSEVKQDEVPDDDEDQQTAIQQKKNLLKNLAA